MKKIFKYKTALPAILFCLFSLAACSSQNQIAAEENNSKEEVKSENLVSDISDIDKEAIQEILNTEVYYYELACYGTEYDRENEYRYQYTLPSFISSYLHYNGIEDENRELGALGTKLYWGIDIDQRLVATVANSHLRMIKVEPTKVDIKNESADFWAEIYLNGIKSYDTHYTFYSEEIPKEVKDTPLSALSYQDKIWKIGKVDVIEPEPITEITEINSLDDFLKFADGLNRQEREYVNGRYILNTDIDLSTSDFNSAGTFSTESMYEINADKFISPVGFNGYFDGQGYTISGFNIEKYQAYLGFFNTVNDNAVIKNLNLEGNVTNLTTDKYENMCTGGFAGIISPNATVENCTFTGNVDGKSNTGGFVGSVSNTGPNISRDEEGYMVGGKGTINNCSFTGNVICSTSSGGFVGYTRGTIKNCASNGNVIIDQKYTKNRILPCQVGGFCGVSDYKIENCYCNSTVNHYLNGANRMGNFLGVLNKYGIEGCTINSDVLNQDWYMVGFKEFRNTKADIKKV